MSRTPPRRADEHLKWLKGQYDPETCWRPEGVLVDPPLAALTGCDHRALEAIDRLLALHSYCDCPAEVLHAVALAASQMQPKMRPLARELIARNKDWSDRERLWPPIDHMIVSIIARRTNP